MVSKRETAFVRLALQTLEYSNMRKKRERWVPWNQEGCEVRIEELNVGLKRETSMKKKVEAGGIFFPETGLTV